MLTLLISCSMSLQTKKTQEEHKEEDIRSYNKIFFVSSKTLMVTIMEAEDIPVRDLSGYAYSFVVAKAKNTFKKNNIQKEYKTKLVRAGFWPSFNDTIEIEIEKEDLDDEVLDLYLCETNQWTKRVGIGQISIEIGKLDLCTKEEQILRKKLKPYNPLADVVSTFFWLSSQITNC